MDFALSAEQVELRDNVLDFSRRGLSGEPEGSHAASIGGFRPDLWERCGEFGILGLPVPNEYGGSGPDMVTTTVAMDALGEGCHDHGLLFSMHAHMWAVVTPIIAFGTQEQRERYLPRLVDGSWVAAHGISEPGSGSDAYSMRARAIKDGDHYVLNGTKTFVTNARGVTCRRIRDREARTGMWGVTLPHREGYAGLSSHAPSRARLTRANGRVVSSCRIHRNRREEVRERRSSIIEGWERSCFSPAGWTHAAAADACVR